MPKLVKFIGLGLLIAVTILSVAGIFWTKSHTGALGGVVILSLCAASGLFGIFVLGSAKPRLE